MEDFQTVEKRFRCCDLEIMTFVGLPLKEELRGVDSFENLFIQFDSRVEIVCESHTRQLGRIS